MIKVESISIKEFRGIRDLTLNLNGGNFAVCGPNGTGKSGIVDALEFALTGNISRLSGEGTGVVSIKDHAPHVDSRNRPDKARVILNVFIPSLGKKAVIDRNVKNANHPTITPSEADIIKVLDYVALHPEFVLSRRELIRYVISTPGNRAKEVQALLRLDQVEELRSNLLKIMNGCEKQVEPLKREKAQAREQLMRVLDITQLTKEKLLSAVNSRRYLLSLAPLEMISPTTSLKDGMIISGNAGSSSRIRKGQATSDINRFRELIINITSDDTSNLCATLIEKLTALKGDPVIVDGVTRENLLRNALNLIKDDSCPVCDTHWNPDDLKQLINGKLKHFDEITKQRVALEKQFEPVKELLSQLSQTMKDISGHGKIIIPPINVQPIIDFNLAISSKSKKLEDFLPLENTLTILQDFNVIPQDVIEKVTMIENVVKAIPEPTQQDAARDYLAVSQERLEAFRGVAMRLKAADERAVLTRKVYDIYSSAVTNVLNGVYKHVEEKFSELYRMTNSEDEGNFESHLIPSIGKLGFDVDFYGRGYFPPGAYHSEGHQDSMGVCLYLALMEHQLGKSFSFSVLDDVLMSVDSAHRREVSNLLKTRFPDTQFILTTHDPVWFKQMKTAGLIGQKSSIHFKNWVVDIGPTDWDNRDVWEEIEDYLTNNDVREAAALLRYYLEYISNELCHCLRATVEFRADSQYTLADLLPRAINKFNKVLSKGENAAKSWGDKKKFEELTIQKSNFNDSIKESYLEQWQINPLVHYNEWANMEKKDFVPVVQAFQKLINFFFCKSCKSNFYIIPERGTMESLKCNCGSGINLKSK